MINKFARRILEFWSQDENIILTIVLCLVGFAVFCVFLVMVELIFVLKLSLAERLVAFLHEILWRAL